MAITHTFKGGKDLHGYGYYAFVEDGRLVIGEHWPREGGDTFRGNVREAGQSLEELKRTAPALYESITKYYRDELADVAHRFRDGRDYGGNGYSGYISKDGQLVLSYHDLRNDGEYYRGTYEGATMHLNNIKVHARILWDDIEKYFNKHEVNDEMEDLKKKYSFDEATKTVLFKVQLYMENRQVHNVLVRGRSQSGVVEKLMPKIPEVLMLQTWDAREFAVRSNKIDAIEFVED